MRYRLSFFMVLVVLIISACSGVQPKYQLPAKKPVRPAGQTERPAGPLPESARPTYNLTGYPLNTQEGYIDGCETAKKSRWGFKDQKRYETDGQYQMGWDDGFDLCRGKK